MMAINVEILEFARTSAALRRASKFLAVPGLVRSIPHSCLA